MHIPTLQGEVLVGDTDAIGAHQPEFVEVRGLNHDISFAPASQFTQHPYTLRWLCRQGVSKALEFPLLFCAYRRAPELAFVFLDRLDSRLPERRHDKRSTEMGGKHRL